MPYYSLVNGPDDVVWARWQPYDEMLAIREFPAFYPDKVDSIGALREQGRKRRFSSDKAQHDLDDDEEHDGSLEQHQPVVAGHVEHQL